MIFKRVFVGCILFLFLVPILGFQPHREGRGLRPFWGGGPYRGHIGIFPIGQLPPRLFSHRVLGRRSRGFGLFGGGVEDTLPVLDSPLGGYPYWFMSNGQWNSGRYSSQKFVDEWRHQDVASGNTVSLEDSILLDEGMTQEEVMGVLGSPLQRIRMGGREVWKYSAYSLFFEEGLLREIR